MVPATGYEKFSDGRGHQLGGRFAADLGISPVPACPGFCECKCNDACWFLKQLTSTRKGDEITSAKYGRGQMVG